MYEIVREKSFTKLTNDEHVGFHTEAIAFINTCSASLIFADALMNEYTKAVEKEREVVNRPTKAEFTEQLAEKDRVRDQALIYFFGTINMAQYSIVPGDKQAYVDLSRALESYKGVTGEGYSVESAKIYELLEICGKTNLQKHLDALRLLDIVQMIKVSNEEFEALNNSRTTEALGYKETNALRMRADELYNQIMEHLNAVVILMQYATDTPLTLPVTPEATELVTSMNNLIHKTNVNYNRRMGIRS